MGPIVGSPPIDFLYDYVVWMWWIFMEVLIPCRFIFPKNSQSMNHIAIHSKPSIIWKRLPKKSYHYTICTKILDWYYIWKIQEFYQDTFFCRKDNDIFYLLSVVDFYSKLTEGNEILHILMPDGITHPIDNEFLSTVMEVPSHPNMKQDCRDITVSVLKGKVCPNIELDINEEIKVMSLLKIRCLYVPG